MNLSAAIPIPSDHCDQPAKMILYLVGDRQPDRTFPLEPVGTFCPDHFWSTRERLRGEGRRTGVEVLETPGICIAPVET